ncbi:MAG: VOC family protein [Myxococcota bacterium]|nr:VOC family protein [Myxococcota bacterium]
MSEPTERRPDLGLSHIALVATDVDASVAFYERYAGLQVVHRRVDEGATVVWLSDLTRPFVVVLIAVPEVDADARLGGFCHVGVGCASREDLDARCERARAEGCLSMGPIDSGPPVGYWAFLRDPDGHHLELSYGQEVGLTVDAARAEDS